MCKKETKKQLVSVCNLSPPSVGHSGAGPLTQLAIPKVPLTLSFLTPLYVLDN